MASHRARVRIQTNALGMNKTEQAYADLLELRKRAGEIHGYRFEPLKFNLGSACFYTPDFEVVLPDGVLEYHEVKGFWRDDARVKIKAVARQFSDRLFVVVMKKAKKHGGGWEREEIRA